MDPRYTEGSTFKLISKQMQLKVSLWANEQIYQVGGSEDAKRVRSAWSSEAALPFLLLSEMLGSARRLSSTCSA